MVTGSSATMCTEEGTFHFLFNSALENGPKRSQVDNSKQIWKQIYKYTARVWINLKSKDKGIGKQNFLKPEWPEMKVCI